MPLRNGPHGYGVVTKTLHWLTVLAIAAQFVVGYTMDDDARRADATATRPARSGAAGDTSDAEEERLDRIEERVRTAAGRPRGRRREPGRHSVRRPGYGGIFDGGLTLPEWHVLLGLTILAIAVLPG